MIAFYIWINIRTYAVSKTAYCLEYLVPMNLNEVLSCRLETFVVIYVHGDMDRLVLLLLN